MHFGLCTFPTDYSMPFPDLAVAAEERGFESLWVAEHSHIPVSRRTPFPGGGELPKMYYDTLDPFVALAAAASVTRTLKLGTGVCLVIQRDPIQTAKEVASLDQLSKGRFLFGIGGGWNEEEMENHGTRFDRRFADPARAHRGDEGDLDPEGGRVPRRVRRLRSDLRVAEAGAEAAPADPRRRRVPGRARSARSGTATAGFPSAIRRARCARMPELRKLAKEAGRDPASIEVSIYYCPPDLDLLTRLRDGGVARAIFGVPSEAAREGAADPRSLPRGGAAARLTRGDPPLRARRRDRGAARSRLRRALRARALSRPAAAAHRGPRDRGAAGRTRVRSGRARRRCSDRSRCATGSSSSSTPLPARAPRRLRDARAARDPARRRLRAARRGSGDARHASRCCCAVRSGCAASCCARRSTRRRRCSRI